MRFPKVFRSAGIIVLAILPLLLVAGVMESGPGKNDPPNPCLLIPEVMNGKMTYEQSPAPYSPESCIAANSGNVGDKASGS